MIPYNICENKWVSNTKKRVEQHYNKNQTLYIFFIGLSFIITFVLAILVSFRSFYLLNINNGHIKWPLTTHLNCDIVSLYE
jgi:uncharacterized protein YacL